MAETRSDDRNPARAPTVLILEDEPMTAMLLAKAVTERGFVVDGPHLCPDEAEAALETRMPDAALLDVSLGTHSTSRVVADRLAKSAVPFAFVTGYGPETASIVSAHPSALVIPKPMDTDTVGVLLRELLASAERA